MATTSTTSANQGPVGAARYLPIAEHGLIGDLRTVALVGTDGTIDWYCCPRFDAPSVFASILDADRGGSFELAATAPAKTKQFYFPDTNAHLEGYQGSAPVRVGNAAADQLQLDIYGALIDSDYLYDKWGQPISSGHWDAVCAGVDWVCGHWDQPDEGVWENRGGRKKFLYSRLMCWVAIERAIQMANRRGLPTDLPRWRESRDAIYRRIMDRCWCPAREAFVQDEDGDVLDAAVLMMPLTNFISPNDPKWLSTLDALTEDLVSDSLVYRYDPQLSPDGMEGEEGTFSICSFWYVEALARAGRVEEARLAFEKMLTYANHLGLYAEEISHTGEQQGNFPQAFTHLALISAAFHLDRALG